MYFLENAFDNDKVNITEIIDRIRVLKTTQNDRKNKYIDNQIQSYIKENCLLKWENSSLYVF